jgi:hypothetical protein
VGQECLAGDSGIVSIYVGFAKKSDSCAKLLRPLGGVDPEMLDVDPVLAD